MRQTLAFIVPAIALYCYMVLSAVEFGASVFRLFPRLLRKKESVATYLNPVWETTNVFLVYFTISMFSFFPGANMRFGTDLLWVLFPALTFFGLRVLGMLLIFYAGVKHRAADLLLAVGSFLAPVTFSIFFIYLLTGSWSTRLASALFLGLTGIVAASIVMLSAAFFRYFGAEKGNRALDRLTRDAFFLASIFFAVFCFALAADAPHVLSAGTRIATVAVLVALAAGLFAYAEYAGRRLLAFLAACALVGSFFFPIVAFHLPYLIYPDVTVYSAFTDPASFDFMAVASAIGMAIIIPALVLLYRLFAVGDEAGRAGRGH